MKRNSSVSRSPASGVPRLQCRAVEGQTIDSDTLGACILWCRKAECERLAWSEHPAEGDKPAHFHFVARWNRTVDCMALRNLANQLDPHSHVDKVGRFLNMVRYLRHLDNPDKVKIPPEDAHYEGFPEDELSAATSEGSDSLALVQMIADLPHGSSPVDALRVCIGAGYRPSEISGVTRALFHLRNLLTDGGRVGVKRNADSVPSDAPSVHSSAPEVCLMLNPLDPAFFAAPWEDVPCIDSEG